MSGTERPDDASLPDPAAAVAAVPAPVYEEAESTATAEIGWVRAIATGVAILLVGFGGAVIGANQILTKARGLRRTPQEWLATALFFAVVVALAWVLRRLQGRKWI